MSNTKKVNNKLSKYQELNDSELQIVCGGMTVRSNHANFGSAKDFVPETISFTKSEAT